MTRRSWQRQRQAPWAALAVNTAMFPTELSASKKVANLRPLQTDALDFLSHTASYAISVGVAAAGAGDTLIYIRNNGSSSR